MRQNLRTRALIAVLLLTALGSAVLTVSLARYVSPETLYWPIVALTGMAVILALVFEKRAIRNWLRGSLAERSVGGVIESALTAPGCAVAHSVYEIPGTVGDIDHLIATPGRLWCVETKSGRVPQRQLRKVLLRILQNVDAVRRWAPQAVEVKGVLVLAQDDAVRPRRDYENGRVQLFRPGELYGKLRNAAKAAPTEPCNDVARRVWKLSGLRLSDK